MALFTPSESPAIITREIDLTNGVPNVPSSTGAIVGNYRWGPCDEPVLVNNEANVARTFGNPDPSTSVDFHSASYYLRYSDDLYIVRKVTGTDNPGPEATFTAELDSDGLLSVALVDGGGGYTSQPTVTVAEANSGTSPTITAAYDSANDAITSLTLTGAGYSYDTLPEITISERADFAVNSYDKTNNPTTVPIIKNQNSFDAQKATLASQNHTFTSKWPGKLGDSIKISMISAADSDYNNWAYKSYFEASPETSEFASSKGAEHDEVHIIVIDEGGEFTGTNGEILETFSYVSMASNAKSYNGTSNFVKDVINVGSKYIWMVDFPTAAGVNAGTAATSGKDFAFAGEVTAQLSGGRNSGALAVADYYTGYDEYSDVNNLLVDFLIAPGVSDAEDHKSVVNHLVSISQLTRKDCVTVASPNRSSIIGNAGDESVDTITSIAGITRSSYLVVDNNYLKVYDKYNDEYIHIPAASSTAGIMAATDNNFAPWYSPAGTRRGQYFGVTSLAYSPNKSQRDELYKAGVNPVANIPGQGVLLYGDKTHLARPSAFDRINVRRLFLVLERAVAAAAQNILFEFNDEFTRAEFVNIIEPLLRDVKGRRGITDFKLVCDETNNTGEIIDSNQFVATLFIKPARSINFITLNFVAVRTGVTFEEVVGSV